MVSCPNISCKLDLFFCLSLKYMEGFKIMIFFHFALLTKTKGNLGDYSPENVPHLMQPYILTRQP